MREVWIFAPVSFCYGWGQAKVDIPQIPTSPSKSQFSCPRGPLGVPRSDFLSLIGLAKMLGKAGHGTRGTGLMTRCRCQVSGGRLGTGVTGIGICGELSAIGCIRAALNKACIYLRIPRVPRRVLSHSAISSTEARSYARDRLAIPRVPRCLLSHSATSSRPEARCFA